MRQIGISLVSRAYRGVCRARSLTGWKSLTRVTENSRSMDPWSKEIVCAAKMNRYWTGDRKERPLPRKFGINDCIGFVEVSMSRIEDYGCKGYNSTKGKKNNQNDAPHVVPSFQTRNRRLTVSHSSLISEPTVVHMTCLRSSMAELRPGWLQILGGARLPCPVGSDRSKSSTKTVRR